MKDIDERIINARPDDEVANERFIKATMLALQAAQANETLSRAVRTESVNKKGRFMAKLLRLPRVALAGIGLAALLLTGGTVYAAVSWFGASVKTSQKDSVVYTVATECAPNQVQALNGLQPQTNTSEYKILKPEFISEHDLRLDQLADCERSAIEASVRQNMPNVYMPGAPGDLRDGLYYPVVSYGKVVSATETQVTVSDVKISHQFSMPEIVTVTIPISTETLVSDKGKKTQITSFEQGDPVFFIFQNPVRPGQNDNDWRAIPSEQSRVLAVAKTQYDVAAIKQKIEKAAAENAFRILKKSDAYGG